MAIVEYQPRLVDVELRDRLQAVGAVLLRGPKACGKTETARQQANSEIQIDDSPLVLTAMASDPTYLLQGATPRLIDEWQEQLPLWNTVRHEVDRRQGKGQFILTGSSTPRDDALTHLHSGVGRFGVVDVRTMTWFERDWSTGDVSLAELLAGGEASSAASDIDLPAVAAKLAVGGWPGNLGLSERHALEANRDYLELLVTQDMRRAAGARLDPGRVRRVLQSLSRNVSAECEISTIAADAGGADGPLSRNTVAEYLEALRLLMVTEDLTAWSAHIRSRARLRKSPKRHFADPSLACSALGLTPDRLLKDLGFLGLLFESQAVHDLRCYAQLSNGHLSHYRDSNGLEADAVLEQADGSWAAFEVKLGFGAVQAGASSLLAFAANIDRSKTGPPLALVVITGSGFAHRRPDGVYVVPLDRLRA
jgi:predicted AAA+ superfamily ATPase